MDWLEARDDGAWIRVRVQPRARKTEVSGLQGGALKVRLAAPPVDGKANQALRRYLARRLGATVSTLRIVAGARNRDKVILASGMSADDVRAAFPEV